MNVKQKGFSLLEVLIAGFILFAVITSMTAVYRGALLSSSKAQKALSIAASVPSIRILVTDAFREKQGGGKYYGEGDYGDLRYEWRATLTHEGEPHVLLLERYGGLRYYLWNIEFTVEKSGQIRRYAFREVSW